MNPLFESLECRRLLAAVVSVRGDDFLINARPAHQGTALHGTLPNVRAVNATFDDANRATQARWKYPDTGRWDASRNLNEFVAQLPSWRASGILAATLSFQGGGPVDRQFGPSQPWDNSAFTSDGSLKPAYTARLEKAIRALDDNGMVAIVNYFYLGQERRLRDDSAVLRATDNATRWLVSKGFRNVIVDAVNESNYSFRSRLLEPNRVHELLRRIDSVSGGRLLVGTSFFGGVLPSSEVVRASDVVFLHGNGKNAAQVRNMIATMRSRTNKPLIFNEDSTNLANFREAARMGVSWGYYDQGRNNYYHGFQSVPVRWSINTSEKRAFAAEVKRLSAGGGSTQPVPPSGAPTSARPAVTRLMLVDAQRDRVIGELRPNQYVDTRALGASRLSVLAEVNGATRSVRFGLDGRSNFRTESHAPFALGGDGNGGRDYFEVPLGQGWHEISATAFTGQSATGSAGSALVVRFRIVSGLGSAARGGLVAQPAPGALRAASPAPGALALAGGVFQSREKVSDALDAAPAPL